MTRFWNGISRTSHDLFRLQSKLLQSDRELFLLPKLSILMSKRAVLQGRAELLLLVFSRQMAVQKFR